jgi:hypothetical protein
LRAILTGMEVTVELGRVTDWLTAIGTIGAVWAALHLANRDNTLRLRAFATVGLIVGGPNPASTVAEAPRYVWIHVTNAGRRTAYLTNIGWRSGAVRQGVPWVGYRHFVQSYLPGSGPQLPLKLEDGQTAQWWLPLDEWMDNNSASMSKSPAWLHMRTTCLQVFTSAGPTLTVKIGSSLRDKMTAVAEEKQAAQRKGDGQ